MCLPLAVTGEKDSQCTPVVHNQICAGNAYPQPNILSNNTLIIIYNNSGLPKLQLYLPYPPLFSLHL